MVEKLSDQISNLVSVLQKIVKKLLWTLVKNFLEKKSDQMEAKIKEKLIGIENKN